jgi:hypothetical protein
VMVVLKLSGLFQKKISQSMGFFIVLLLLIGPLVWLGVSHPHYLQTIGNIVAQNAHLFLIFRWLLIVSLFIGWHLIIEDIGTRFSWSTDKTQFWIAQRLKITVWLVLFELVICENILLTAFHLIERF